MSDRAERLVAAAQALCARMEPLTFGLPVTHVYNPLMYAWDSHADYLSTYGTPCKKVVFLGMNPGPFGMVQTGVPFGEIAAVRHWMKIRRPVKRPPVEHPKRPILGFDCPRSEVSGKRLWGLFAKRFGSAPSFFKDHFVVNYCPLAFLEESGRNFTPNKLPRETKRPLEEACDEHLKQVIAILQPGTLVGVGDFAFKCLQRLFKEGSAYKLARIAHPSPASPAANKDWAGLATQQLIDAGLWQ